MAATVRAAIRELMEQTMATMDALLEASDQELPMASSHACAQRGGDFPVRQPVRAKDEIGNWPRASNLEASEVPLP
jgi:hypothetical protein